jgi:chromatin modification-related protein EAF6
MATGSENAPPAGARTDGAGRPFYDRQAAELKALIKDRDKLAALLATTENSIYDKETEYLEDTPNGNIVVGFDQYTKGTSAATGARRRGGVNDAHRIFSNSSVSYKSAAVSWNMGKGGEEKKGERSRLIIWWVL